MPIKSKVNPELKVEMKQSLWKSKQQMPRLPLTFYRPLQAQLPPPPSQQLRPLFPMNRTTEVMDDRHVLFKVTLIQPSSEETQEVEKVVLLTEKALKNVSDSLAVEKPANVDANAAVIKAADDSNGGTTERVLKGVMRVGLMAKNLTLKTDKKVA